MIKLLFLPIFLFSQEIEIQKITSVYDGDTFNVDLKCDIELLCKNIPVRVKNIDTPEMRTKSITEKALGQQAKSFTVNFLKQEVKLINCTRDKYFRINCDVYSKDKSLSEELIKRRLGIQYDGGTKVTNWSTFK